MTPEFDFGEKVRHKLTGYSGTITARLQRDHGLVEYQVVSDVLCDGTPVDYWIPAQHLESCKKTPPRVAL